MKAGQDPFGLKFVQPDRSKLIVLSLVDDDPKPSFEICGRTRCLECDRWCWLGSETMAIVENGEAMPMCQYCAAPIVEPGLAIKRVLDRPNLT